jgi:hypothetical protein
MFNKPTSGLYHLPKLQEMVVPAAIAYAMALNVVPKQKSKQKPSLCIAIYLV